MSNPTLQSKLLKLIEDIPPAPYSEQRMRTESFGDGQECENARLKHIFLALIECVGSVAEAVKDTDLMHEDYEGYLGDAETALARIEALVKETE